MVMGGRANAPRAVPLAHRPPCTRRHWQGRYAGCSPRTAACRLPMSVVRGVQSARSPTLEMRTCGRGCLGQL